MTNKKNYYYVSIHYFDSVCGESGQMSLSKPYKYKAYALKLFERKVNELMKGEDFSSEEARKINDYKNDYYERIVSIDYPDDMVVRGFTYYVSLEKTNKIKKTKR